MPETPEIVRQLTTLLAKNDTVPPDRLMIVDVLIFPVPVIHIVGEPETEIFVTLEEIHPEADPPILIIPVALPKRLNTATLLIVILPSKTPDVPVSKVPNDALISELVEL